MITPVIVALARKVMIFGLSDPEKCSGDGHRPVLGVRDNCPQNRDIP